MIYFPFNMRPASYKEYTTPKAAPTSVKTAVVWNFVSSQYPNSVRSTMAMPMLQAFDVSDGSGRFEGIFSGNSNLFLDYFC
jgi:hypothetical protein